jgi:poly-beta-1,6-N-acetyl-D-glucosamine synthase
MKTSYVIITPVLNEEKNIRHVLDAVISQTIRPDKWVIVDDGSTDGTGDIVNSYQKSHDFIIWFRPERKHTKSYYAYRTQAALAGYESINNLAFDFAAFLDADLFVKPDYYENILTEFDRNPRLGIATGIYINKINDHLERVVRSDTSTPGGLQMFRRECYEAIGGYHLMKYGGDDSLADIMARMHGWETRSFPQYEVIHNRPTGTATGKHILAVRFYQGFAEYHLATHPVFMLAKSIRRAFIEKPYIIGSGARLLGYITCLLKREKRDIPAQAAGFVRKEQIRRLFGGNE